MNRAIHGIATAISVCSVGAHVFAPVIDGTASVRLSPVYEEWSGSSGWLPLPDAPVGAPTESWRVELSGDASYVVQAGLVVVAESSNGTTTAVRRIDAATGRDVWRAEVAGTGDAQLAIDPAGSTLVVASEAPDGSFVATLLGAGKGQVIWEGAALDAAPFGQPFAPLVIVATSTESFAVNAADGVVTWRADAPVTVYPGSLVFHSAPSAAGGDRAFGLIDPATGARVWERERPRGAIATSLGGVVMLSHDEAGSQDSLVGFDGTTGRQLWTTAVALVGSSGGWPLGEDGALYGGNNDPDLDGSLVAVDVLTGSSRWTRPYHKPGGLAMWRADGRQVVFSRAADGTVELIDAGTGETALSSDDVPSGWPLFSSGSLYFQDSDSGIVDAIDMSSLRLEWSVERTSGLRLAGAVAGGFVAVEDATPGGNGLVLAGFLG